MMKHYLMILALLAQAPKATEFNFNNGSCGVEACKEPTLIIHSELSGTVYRGGGSVTISDNDFPVGPCDLGKLVKVARTHLELEHSDPPSSAICGKFDNLRFIRSECVGVVAPADEFASWEVCGDEIPTGVSNNLLPLDWSNPPRASPDELRKMADCIERRTAKEKRRNAFLAAQSKKVDDALTTLRAELERCEPKAKEKP
jgi:hypothetical protein